MTGYPTPTFDSVTVNGQLTASNLPPTPNTSIELAYCRINSTGTAYEARTPQQSVSDLQFLSSLNNASARSLFAKLSDFVSVKDFGAKGDGATDDTTAINNALAIGGFVFFPPGNYIHSNNLNITVNGTWIMGGGQGVTTLTNTTAANSSFVGGTGITSAKISNMTITRSTTATSGGNGIDFSHSCSNCLICDVHVLNHYYGVQLGNTDTSYLMRSLIEKNQSDGVRHTTAANQGSALQWSMRDVLSQANAGNGFTITSSGTSGVALGEWMHIETYANSGYGVQVQGISAAPINGFRLHNSFLGQDGNSEIYLDTYGGLHQISDTFTELAGTGATGPTGGTAASHVGGGLLVTGNNTDIVVSSLSANAHSDDGFQVAATEAQFVGCRATNSGQHGVNVTGFSIPSSSARAMFSGCRSGNTGTNTTQQYGIAVANGNNILFSGCDLTGNTVQAFNDTAATNAQVAVGNLPSSVNTNLPAGSLLVGKPTGTAPANGINTAGGVALNGTTYTNP